MIRKTVIGLICIMATGIQLDAAQDFERSYSLVPGRHITIDNRMGDVKVTGYDGEEIKVVARKEGPDREEIKIVDQNFDHRIVLFPMNPKFKHTRTKVDFEVQVPKSAAMVHVVVKSGSGKIEVRDFNGWLMAESFRGESSFVNVKGFLSARSVSGQMKVEISQSKGKNQMQFDSMSGDILVTAPPDLNALVTMKSVGGGLKTDFPLSIRQRRYGEQTAKGKLGSGQQMIWISSNSGSVSLLKNDP